MTKTKRNIAIKMLSVLVLAVLAVTALVACTPKSKDLTFRQTTDLPAVTWNPYAWTYAGENEILARVASPYYERVEVLNDQGQATVGDDGLVKTEIRPLFASGDPYDYGLALASRTEGPTYGFEKAGDQLADSYKYRAWRVPLRGDMKWQDGKEITMSDIEYSYKTLLSPEFSHYRSDLMRTGSAAIVGANAYWGQARQQAGQQYKFDYNYGAADKGVSWDSVGIEFLAPQDGDPEHTMGSVLFVYESPAEAGLQEIYSRWSYELVHPATFQKYIVDTNGLKASSYNSSVEKSMSYGPYKMASWTAGSGYVLERVATWATERDKQKRFPDEYSVTHIKTNQVTNAATRLLQFNKGEYDFIPLVATDVDYKQSKQRYDVTSSYSMRIYFNYDREALKKIETGSMATSSKAKKLNYIANNNFRKAFSLAMNRAALADQYSPASTPSVVLWNEVYFNHQAPFEQYRFTDDALKALFDRAGVDSSKWDNATMRKEYEKLTGYDKDEAKKLFAQSLKDEGDTSAEVVFTLWTGSAANVTAQTPAINALQDNINAATEGTGLKVTINFEAQPSGTNRYYEVDQGRIEAMVGANGGATSNISNPLRSFLGLGSSQTSGGTDYVTYGFKPETIDQTIDLAPLLKYDDTRIVKVAQDLLDYNKTSDKEGSGSVDGTKLTLKLNQWATMFGKTQKPATSSTYPIDTVNYNFLPETVDGKTAAQDINHPYIGRGAIREWFRHVTPYLETAILDQYGQIPFVMDITANLASFRYKPLLEKYDAVMGLGSFRFHKLTQNDGDWADYAKKNNLEGAYKLSK